MDPSLSTRITYSTHLQSSSLLCLSFSRHSPYCDFPFFVQPFASSFSHPLLSLTAPHNLYLTPDPYIHSLSVPQSYNLEVAFVFRDPCPCPSPALSFVSPTRNTSPRVNDPQTLESELNESKRNYSSNEIQSPASLSRISSLNSRCPSLLPTPTTTVSVKVPESLRARRVRGLVRRRKSTSLRLSTLLSASCLEVAINPLLSLDPHLEFVLDNLLLILDHPILLLLNSLWHIPPCPILQLVVTRSFPFRILRKGMKESIASFVFC